jgi:hypothetical protein
MPSTSSRPKWAPPEGLYIASDPEVSQFDYKKIPGIAIQGPRGEKHEAWDARIESNGIIYEAARQEHNDLCEAKQKARSARERARRKASKAARGAQSTCRLAVSVWCLMYCLHQAVAVEVRGMEVMKMMVVAGRATKSKCAILTIANTYTELIKVSGV